MNAWIFDLDGVVTDLQKKKITNPRILEYMTQFLQKKEPVCLNTGRSLEFIRQEVFNSLLSYLPEHNLPENLLNNFFAVGEKGNAWIENEKDEYDLQTAIPSSFAEEVKQLVEQEFSDTMFFDTTKKTMISVEMKNGENVDVFHQRREEFIPAIVSLLKKYNLKNLIIDKSNISTDIQHSEVGKAFGIERILTWLDEQKHQPNHFYCFGDSPSDLAMGEALQKANKEFTFVYTGQKEILNTTTYPFAIYFTKHLFTEGTVEFLEENS